MLQIPRVICCDLNQAIGREWLVTNGLGGYASGTITGANTRRYHGLLAAALKPPAARVMTLAKLDEELVVDGTLYRLGTNEYESGTVYPEGYLFLDRFELDGMIPTFFYRSATFMLKKNIWMEHEHNTTYIRYVLESASGTAHVTLLPLCTYRDIHVHARGWLDWHFTTQLRNGDITLTANPDAVPYHFISLPSAKFALMDLWYWRFRHRADLERGQDSIDDLYLPGQWQIDLEPGQSFTIVVTTEDPTTVDRDVDAAYQREWTRQAAIQLKAQDDFERQLFLAADQFIVRRQVDHAHLNTIIAGYPWLGDWGRDTMVALEGLTLLTERFTEARNVLLAYANYVDQGLLPNCFPANDVALTPSDYTSVDASLWYLHAIDRYVTASGDMELLHQLFPVLDSIIRAYVQGTRHNIHVDPTDGLLSAGVPEVQLTWMDVLPSNRAINSRIGKPVEVNALWYHALRLMEQWAKQLGQPVAAYGQLVDRVRSSFSRFWYARGGYLYDVLDTPYGDDPSLRPNQLFALSLVDDLVPLDQAKSIMEIVTRDLLTPYGLRTLSPEDPRYQGLYLSDPFTRDTLFHQGLVWAWLMGPYMDAYLKLYGKDDAARTMLEMFEAHLLDAGLGSISGVFEADPPYRSVSCVAQAWCVAEILRIKKKLDE